MQSISDKLRNTVVHHKLLLSARSDPDSATPGHWSKKQILGHLVDSASNNHQRFVRAQLQDELTWPGYDQSGSVRVQQYSDYPWPALVELWASYNHFLAHVLESVPESKRYTICRIGDYAPMTLEELALDYIRHMEHHLSQIND